MGKTLVLLHGALGSKQQLEPLKKSLGNEWKVLSLNFPGHGGEPIPGQMFMPDLVEHLRQYIIGNVSPDDELSIFGYSMGGYAALMLAANGGCKIDRIITLGTKLAWDPASAEAETKMLDASIIEAKVPAFANELKERHQPADWKLLLQRTAELMHDLGKNQYLNGSTFSKITCQCKLMVGDKDKMVSLDETVKGYKNIPAASLSVLPSTPHPIEKVDVARLVFELNT